MTREEELQHQLDEAHAEAEALRHGIEKILTEDRFPAITDGDTDEAEEVVCATGLRALLDRIDAGGSAAYREHIADLEAKLAAVQAVADKQSGAIADPVATVRRLLEDNAAGCFYIRDYEGDDPDCVGTYTLTPNEWWINRLAQDIVAKLEGSRE